MDTDDYSYLQVLQDIANSYNFTYQWIIGTTATSIKDTNQEEVRLATYFAQNPRKSKINAKLKPFKFTIGHHVRINHLKTVLTRAYYESFSGEVFQVFKRYHRGTLPIYRLQNMQQEEIKGTFTRVSKKK